MLFLFCLFGVLPLFIKYDLSVPRVFVDVVHVPRIFHTPGFRRATPNRMPDSSHCGGGRAGSCKPAQGCPLGARRMSPFLEGSRGAAEG